MEAVKEERVSPLLHESAAFISPESNAVAGIPSQAEFKPIAIVSNYHEDQRSPSPQRVNTLTQQQAHSHSPADISNYKSLLESTTSSMLNNHPEADISISVRSKNGLRESCAAERGSRCLSDFKDEVKEHQIIFPPTGDISDAVSRILEDYDWSKIPLANSDRRKVHVKRPMNAFMVWAQEARKKLSGQHRQVHNAELSKSLGRIWRGMSDDQKKPFIERAEQLRKKHKQEYPDYKYQPRRRKENIKSVSGNKSPTNPSCVSVQDLTAAHAFASMKGLQGMHPLSPPNSPATNHSGGRCHEPHGGMQEAVFVGDCISDSFDGIDRAEMNKYLLPDQGMAAYVHSTHSNTLGATSSLCPSSVSHMTTIGNMPVTANTAGSMSSTAGTVSSATSISPGNSLAGSCSNVLPPLQSLSHSRLMPSTSGFASGNVSPYYQAGISSPQEGAASGSPGVIIPESIAPSGSPVEDSGGSPESPVDYVELQPPKMPKEESLTTLGNLKSPVNHFLPQNLCYTQHYPYNYPYAYPVWHG